MKYPDRHAASYYGGGSAPLGQGVRSVGPTTDRRVRRTAEFERIGQLLRRCREKAEALARTTDPIDSALLGDGLTTALQDLWQYRGAREPGWGEILNVLQIAIVGRQFEFLKPTQRKCLLKIFDDDVLSRPLGRPEMERVMALISDSGFDIWAGLAGPEEEEEKDG